MKRNEIPTPVPGHQKASAVVTAALGTLAYPVTKQEAIARVGGWQIPYDRETKVPLADLLAGVPVDQFTDVSQAARVVDQHWGRLARNLEAVEQAERSQRKAPARR